MLTLLFAAAGRHLLNLSQGCDEDVTANRRLVKQWLNTSRDFLLVFDAADNVNILQALGEQSDLRYIPLRHFLKGHVIVTSRCPKATFQYIRVMNPIVLESLDLENAMLFLKRRVYHDDQLSTEEDTSLLSLADRYMKKGLLLFIEQTASYIRNNNLTFTEYLAKLDKRPERKPVDRPAFGSNLSSTDDAFECSIADVAANDPAAAILLNMAGFCSSHKVPFSLYIRGAMAFNQDMPQGELAPDRARPPSVPGSVAPEHQPTFNRGRLELDENVLPLIRHIIEVVNLSGTESSAGNDYVRDLLTCAWKYQLIGRERGDISFTIHEVVQEQLRLQMKREGKYFHVLLALGTMILHMLTHEDVTMTTKREIISHAESCTSYMSDSPPPHAQERLFHHLHIRLLIQQAHLFALFGSFATATKIMEEIDRKIHHWGHRRLRIEVLVAKTEICIRKHQPNEALNHGNEAIWMLREANESESEPELEPKEAELASVHKSCAHALLMLGVCDGEELANHLDAAKLLFWGLLGEYYMFQSKSSLRVFPSLVNVSLQKHVPVLGHAP